MLSFSKLRNYFYAKHEGFSDLVFDLLSFTYIKVYLGFILFINFIIWLLAFYIDSEIDSAQIALHYNVDFGIDYYGNKNNVYIIPFLGLLILLINFILLTNLSRSQDRKFISHVLLVSALTVNSILLIAIISVYLINFV